MAKRPGVAVDRHDRHRAAAADVHADEVGRAVRRVRGPGRRARRGHRVRVRTGRTAQPTQPRAVRDRAAVRIGLGDFGYQRLVLRRQLRRAVVRQAAGDRRDPGPDHLPGAGDPDRSARRLAALPDGLHGTHRGRQHPPQPGARVYAAAGGGRHHGGARGGFDGQGRRPALSRVHHRQGQRRRADVGVCRSTSCAMADDVLVEPDTNAGLLQPVPGQRVRPSTAPSAGRTRSGSPRTGSATPSSPPSPSPPTPAWSTPTAPRTNRTSASATRQAPVAATDPWASTDRTYSCRSVSTPNARR